MGPGKQNRALQRDVDAQKKARRKVKVDNQIAYTDSNRAMAVCIGDKELSKALKNFEKDFSVEEMNAGMVNSEMYKRQALHYSARKQHEAARKYLESAHKLDPDDLEILSFLGEASLSCGDSTAAMGYAEAVLEKDTSHLKAIVVKAESLYSTCQFEHALALFLRGSRLAPDSTIMVMGITKSKKAILSKVSEKDVFFFPGSKNFIDFLRADGYGGVAKFCAPLAPKKGFQGFATRVVLQQAVVDPEEKKGKNKMVRDRMKTDKDYLRQLGNMLGDGGSLDLKERVSSEVASAVHFLDARDQFWTQID